MRHVVTDVDVFARASPEHKLRLVQALQANGEVVAMTGDGVNDAPALKRADVGVAMGKNGTEAAKDAAAMVLADDNFATLGHAVREGRGIYDNVRKFILFMLPTNGGEALIVFSAIVFGLVLPLRPVQVLWINLVTSSTLGVALAFEPTEGDVMRRRPRSPRQSLLSGLFVWRVVMVSVLMACAALGLFLWELGHGSSLETAPHHGRKHRGAGRNVLPLQQPPRAAQRPQPRRPAGQPQNPRHHRPVRRAAAGLRVHPLAAERYLARPTSAPPNGCAWCWPGPACLPLPARKSHPALAPGARCASGIKNAPHTPIHTPACSIF